MCIRDSERCVRAYDFGGDAGHVYIAYEYVRGRTLRETLRTDGLADAEAVEIAAQVHDPAPVGVGSCTGT